MRECVAGLLERGAQPSTARSRQLAVRRFTAWLTKEGEIPADPFLGVKAPKLDPRVIEPLTDDELRRLLTAYADDRRAVIITHDREFSARRRKNVVGQHVYLRCADMEAATVLQSHLEEVIRLLRSGKDTFIAVSKEGIQRSRKWE